MDLRDEAFVILDSWTENDGVVRLEGEKERMVGQKAAGLSAWKEKWSKWWDRRRPGCPPGRRKGVNGGTESGRSVRLEGAKERMVGQKVVGLSA